MRPESEGTASKSYTYLVTRATVSEQDWGALAEEMYDRIDGIEVSVGDKAIEVMGDDGEWLEKSDSLNSAQAAVEEVLVDHDGLDYRIQSVLEHSNPMSKRILVSNSEWVSNADLNDEFLEKELMGAGIWEYSGDRRITDEDSAKE